MPFWSSKEKVTYGEGLIPSELLQAVRDRSTDDNDSKAQLTDGVLSRFLEDAKYDADKVVEMVQQYIKYRTDNYVGEMLGNPPHENIFRKYTIGTWHKTDRDGHPVNYDRVGEVDQVALFTEAGEKECVTRHMWFNERLVEECEKSTKRCGKLVTRAILVKDMGALVRIPNMQQVRIFSAMSSIERTYYPQSLVKIYMVNTSWLVQTGWSLLKNFLSADTRDKVVFLGADYQEVLARELGPENVPSDFGGSSDKIGNVPSMARRAEMEAEDKVAQESRRAKAANYAVTSTEEVVEPSEV